MYHKVVKWLPQVTWSRSGNIRFYTQVYVPQTPVFPYLLLGSLDIWNSPLSSHSILSLNSSSGPWPCYISCISNFQGSFCASLICPRSWQAWISLYILPNTKDGTSHAADTAHVNSDIGDKELLWAGSEERVFSMHPQPWLFYLFSFCPGWELPEAFKREALLQGSEEVVHG